MPMKPVKKACLKKACAVKRMSLEEKSIIRRMAFLSSGVHFGNWLSYMRIRYETPAGNGAQTVPRRSPDGPQCKNTRSPTI